MEEQEVVTADKPAETATPAQGETVVTGESATPPADAKTEEPRKKGGGFQKRIDRLTRTVYELEAKLATKSTESTPTDEKEPKRDDFEDLESFNRALAKHTAKQVIKEEREQSQKAERERTSRTEQSRRAETWESHVEKVSEKFEDGDDVIQHFMSEVSLHPFALDAVIESDIGGELAYFLGKNEKEAERIAKLSPARQASEIGKLEAKLASQPTKKASSAPAPINPVTGKSGGDAGLSDELSTAEWIKRRSKQVHGKR